MRPIFLIGFMGTGKSTLGRAVAARAGILEFIDLDKAAEKMAGGTAAELFSAGRAAAFRAAEEAALAGACMRTDVIVACGGGTPCFGCNMERMLASGTVVRLVADRGRLLRRIAEAPGQRPLLAGLTGKALAAKVDGLSAAREAVYSRAHACFDATFLETESEVDATARKFIEKFVLTASET